EKTLITHAQTGRARFLGYEIGIMYSSTKLTRLGTRGVNGVVGEHGDAGGYAATGISSTSRSMSGYQRLTMALSSPFSVRTRVCNNKCAPSLDHCMCCFLQKRLLTTSFTVDSTNPVAIGSPLRYRSP